MIDIFVYLLLVLCVFCVVFLLVVLWVVFVVDIYDVVGNWFELLIEQFGIVLLLMLEGGDLDMVQVVLLLYCIFDCVWCVCLIVSCNNFRFFLQVQEFVLGEFELCDCYVGYIGFECDGWFQVWFYFFCFVFGLGVFSVFIDLVQVVFENVVVGVIVEWMIGYLGGGVFSSMLLLEMIYYIDEGVEISSVLLFLVVGQVSICVCYGEQDVVLCKGVCYDEYCFSVILLLLLQGCGMLLLCYVSIVICFLVFVLCSCDLLVRGVLSDCDLCIVCDLDCSFEWILCFDLGCYVVELVLLDCSEFIELQVEIIVKLCYSG